MVKRVKNEKEKVHNTKEEKAEKKGFPNFLKKSPKKNKKR